jgi:hypothetical protein
LALKIEKWGYLGLNKELKEFAAQQVLQRQGVVQ